MVISPIIRHTLRIDLSMLPNSTQASYPPRKETIATEIIYSTIVEGPHAGLALVFPSHWKSEQMAEVLSLLDAETTVSNPYIATDPDEINEAITRANQLKEGTPTDERHFFHFRDYLSEGPYST